MNTQGPEPVSAPTPLPSPRRRRRWLTVLLGLTVFASGVVFGGAGTAILIVSRIQHAIRNPERAPARITARLKGRLGLSDEQAGQVRDIIARRQAALQQIRRDVQPRVETEFDAVKDEISAVLDPEQRKTWEELFDRVRERWLPPPPAEKPE